MSHALLSLASHLECAFRGYQQGMNSSNKKIFAAFGLGATGAAGLSWWLAHRGGSLKSSISENQQTWTWRGRDINYAESGAGEPLVLIHGLQPGAANSQWEMNFDHMSRLCRVFAPDLLGFGLSDRPNVPYSTQMYRDLIEAFLLEVVEKPAVVVASGQSAPILIALASKRPDLITKIVLDTPAGLARFANAPSISERLAYAFLRLPVVGSLGFFAIVSKLVIGRRLRRQALADPELSTHSLIDGLYRQTHRPGAKWAPIAALSGQDNCDVRDAYQDLPQRILVVCGESPSCLPAAESNPFVQLNSRAELRTFPDCGLLPEYEHPSKFNNLIENWALLHRAA